jgi:hypothetical protein
MKLTLTSKETEGDYYCTTLVFSSIASLIPEERGHHFVSLADARGTNVRTKERTNKQTNEQTNKHTQHKEEMVAPRKTDVGSGLNFSNPC